MVEDLHIFVICLLKVDVYHCWEGKKFYEFDDGLSGRYVFESKFDVIQARRTLFE